LFIYGFLDRAVDLARPGDIPVQALAGDILVQALAGDTLGHGRTAGLHVVVIIEGIVVVRYN